MDVVIGTHRLLSKDVKFRDLGLVVIDEEHRFGVAQKERIRQITTTVDVLAMTATPIPRTLNLSLAGARDMSVIETPPRDRLPVHTEILELDEEVVTDAILREVDRGGQAFFVHNRVETIHNAALRLQKLVPQVRVAVAHGQMPERELERVMLEFLDRRWDVLVSTMIIESGIDMPSVNTLIVDRADTLGLAQLYQLRGRVGRSAHRAYAYLLVPSRRVLTEEAEKRLRVIEELDELGVGFKIALKDMEIRGAGNLLGPEQHGFILGLGFDLYVKLLEDAVAELKGAAAEVKPEPRLLTDWSAFLPDDYVPDEHEKLNLYRRLAGTRTDRRAGRPHARDARSLRPAAATRGGAVRAAAPPVAGRRQRGREPARLPGRDRVRAAATARARRDPHRGRDARLPGRVLHRPRVRPARARPGPGAAEPHARGAAGPGRGGGAGGGRRVGARPRDGAATSGRARSGPADSRAVRPARLQPPPDSCKQGADRPPRPPQRNAMRPSPIPARLLASLPLLVLFAALLAGCSSGPAVLARVGNRTITVDDFLDVASRNQGQYAGGPDSAKAALLEDLVKRELVVIDALQRGIVGPEDQARMLQQAREQLALRALIQHLAPRDAPVSDAEVQALYQRRAQEARALIVFTPDRATCDRALAEIQGGADFGATADRFNTTGLSPKGGDLGFITAGTMMPVLDTATGDGPVGKVLGPIESPTDGWFLVKVIERRPRQQEPFEQVREALRQGLRQGKQRVLLNRAQRDLLAQYHVTVEAGAPQALFARYNAPKDTVSVSGYPMPEPAKPTPEEARQVLVRYDGEEGKPGTYTLGEAVLDLQDPSKPRPNWSVMPMIEQWLKSAALQRVALIEARQRHLAEEPALARQARAQMENVLLQSAYETLVLATATVTGDDVRAAYERHASQFPGKDGRPIEFARLDPNHQQALRNEALEFARERRLREFTDTLALQLKPVVYKERLKQIPWPVPPAEPGR